MNAKHRKQTVRMIIEMTYLRYRTPMSSVWDVGAAVIW